MKIVSLVIAGGLLAGCASRLPGLQTGPDPADPALPVTAAPYQPVTAGTADYQPIGPKPWRDMNERVGPGGRRTP
jgi:hypothetical protein